jgi:HYR domain-containing protein
MSTVALGCGFLLDELMNLGRIAVAATVAGLAFVVDASSSKTLATSNLDLRATLLTDSVEVRCPAQAPPQALCRARSGRSRIRGLGNVSSSYTWLAAAGDCPAPLVKPFPTSGRLVVAQKGEIDFALAGGACVEQEPVRNEPQQFTITGGTGIYQGASGQGTVARSLAEGSGSETWTGTLTVPGLDFDLTPPKIAGAVSRTVRAKARAKRKRVTYKVTARDAVDGVVAVPCSPRSGSFFKRGRTAVRCRASDKSANTASARFVITLR